MFVVAWILTGLGLSILGRAVSPPDQALGALLAAALGILGGLGGGFLVEGLATRTVPGFTAGEIGSIMGASVLLIVGSVLKAPRERAA
jgi:uncharacterized membrane protein YeaQ/YmgE (transglycosylase-associated protein family)